MASVYSTEKAIAQSKSTYNQLSLAYIAGLIDGEGCFAAAISNNPSRKAIRLGMRIVISNNDEAVLRWCHKFVGTGVVVVRPAKGRNKATWRYILEGDAELLNFVSQLQPFLKIKKEQARWMLQYLRSRSVRPRRSPYNEAELNCFYRIRELTRRRPGCGLTYKKKDLTYREFIKLAQRDRSNYQVIDWTSEMDTLVGTDIDKVIAVKLGITRSQVQERRVRLGRPAHRWISDGKKDEVWKLAKKKLTLTDIAKRTGISFSSVQRILAV